MDSKPNNRKSLRLPHYDYSASGYYFITICCQNKACLFGNVIDDEARLNPAGEMIDKWYFKLEGKFPQVKCREMVIMPNHFHCIIEIKQSNLVVADPRVCPRSQASQKGGHMGPPLPRIIQWFKTMTTNAYIQSVKESGWHGFDRRLWQRNYYEHVIRSEESYLALAEYIQTNPIKWQEDKYHIPTP